MSLINVAENATSVVSQLRKAQKQRESDQISWRKRESGRVVKACKQAPSSAPSTYKYIRLIDTPVPRDLTQSLLRSFQFAYAKYYMFIFCYPIPPPTLSYPYLFAWTQSGEECWTQIPTTASGTVWSTNSPSGFDFDTQLSSW